MRNRVGKGQVIAFDASVLSRIEELRKEKGYYPMLKEIGASFTPPCSAVFVFRSLRRLSEAGRLSEEASQVYDSKNKKGKSHGVKKSVKGTKRVKK